MSTTTDNANAFFDTYAAALLDRDEAAMADLYAIPSLIVFPGNLIAVTDKQQTEEFFASSWEQYEGVDRVERDLKVMAETAGVVWVDITWYYGGEPRERFCYQLVEVDDTHRVAVLTPFTG